MLNDWHESGPSAATASETRSERLPRVSVLPLAETEGTGGPQNVGLSEILFLF